MDKAKKILPWVLTAVYMLVMLTFISSKRKEITCEEVDVLIMDKNNNYFVEEVDVISMLDDNGERILGAELESINVNDMEELLNMHPSIKQANVHRNLNGKLAIKIEQRNPILRVITKNGESYYIDQEGALMPLSSKYAAHVLVVNGDLIEPYSKRHALKLNDEESISEENEGTMLFDLYELALFIYKSDFWRVQIEQIYVNKGNIELVPRVGTHIIELGKSKQYDKKFRNLKALYDQGLSKVGWNNYKTINLKYNNQVICTKR